MDVRIPEFGENGFPSGMSVLCYDDDRCKDNKYKTGSDEYIGKSFIQFEPTYFNFKVDINAKLKEL